MDGRRRGDEHLGTGRRSRIAAAAGDLSEELLRTERRLQAAQLAGDVAALDELLDDRLIATLMPDATVSTKADDLASHRSRELELTRLVEEEVALTVAERTGVTRVVTDMAGRFRGQPFELRMLYTRTWHYDDNGGWRVLGAHISPI